MNHSFDFNRRRFLERTALGAVALYSSRPMSAADPSDLKAIFAEADKRHDEAVARLQNWIRHPAIAAENRAMNEGAG